MKKDKGLNNLTIYNNRKLLFTLWIYKRRPEWEHKKIVEYSATGTENVYNLAFGDLDEITNTINDLSITNNGDSLKVLATVASTVYAFMEKHPNAWIVATGSTKVRTRLYRMGITNNLAKDDLCEVIQI